MAITLAMAQVNTQDDVDFTVIDEFRKSSFLLNALTFDDCVSPGTNGATLTYGYTRHITERAAATRQINTEYTPAEAHRQRYTVDLVPMGGKFPVDRVVANLGPAASNEVTYQMRQLIKAAVAKFHDEFINGTAADFSQEDPGFDGLAEVVQGTVTDYTATQSWDSPSLGVDGSAAVHDALDELDEWMDTLDGLPDVIISGDKGIARLRSLARRANYYERIRDEFGREVETYRGVPFANLREKDGSTDPIIPTVDGETDLYAVRFGLDSVHGVSVVGGQLVRTWLPDFTTEGAVKHGEAELGPVAIAAKKTRGVGAFHVRVEQAPDNGGD
ncbi:phage capsid protein [Phytoactinopolyspora alkaliphila]|uniref:Phage capsid protein n=1 Tax=Phytoactinopolyspora alkaliphila TaxID=1783498 RepID=A0A6N9YNA0_9ACTN|nr:phage capsid protein [Phytoactinopolyspora alkaliphila]NED96452.1 phage capsid protein [Phytoactinopolyspora alkaliphila]